MMEAEQPAGPASPASAHPASPTTRPASFTISSPTPTARAWGGGGSGILMGSRGGNHRSPMAVGQASPKGEQQQQKQQDEGEDEELDLSGDSSSDDSDAEEDEGMEVGDKSGNLNVRVGSVNKKGQIKHGSKWMYAYFVLVGGSLHYYVKKEKKEPKASITVKEAKLVKHVEFRPFKHCFSLTSATMEIIFSAQSEEELKTWTSALETAATKPPASPPTQDAENKPNLRQRATRSVIAKTSTSHMGKRAIKRMAPKEMIEVMTAFKTLVERETGSSKKGTEMEDSSLRVGVKIYFLVLDGKVAPSQIVEADQSLRQALKIFIGCRNHVCAVWYSGRVQLNKELLQIKLEEVAKLVKQVGESLTEILVPHMRPSHIDQLTEMMNYFGNPEVLMRVILEPSFESELDVLVWAAERYSQVPLYEEDLKPSAKNRRKTMMF